MLFGLSLSSLPAITAWTLALFLSLNTQGQAGQSRPEHSATDSIEAWPVTDIKQWIGYKDLPTIEDPSAPSERRPRNESSQSPAPNPQQHTDRQARLRLLWEQAQPEARRILKAIRADLVTELSSMAAREQSTGDVLVVASHDSTKPPYIKMEFAIENGILRTTHIHIYASAMGTEPPVRRRVAWRRFAEKTFEQIFGQKPGRWPETVTSRNSLYMNWKTRWQNQPLPPRYWMQFGVVKHGDHWVYAWTARSTPAQVTATRQALDGYPIRFGHRQAVMTAVKNAFVLVPDIIDDRAEVWATFKLIQPDRSSSRWSQTRYLDRPALERSIRGRPLLAVWQIRIIPKPRRLPFLIALVDPEEGQLLRLNIQFLQMEGPLAR